MSKQNDWEIRFDEFRNYDGSEYGSDFHYRIKDFIRKELADARREVARHIKEAWLNEGVCPPFHHRAQQRLLREWPTLYKAILATLKEETL